LIEKRRKVLILKKQVRFLRIAFLAGAILDGVMVFPMLFPKIAGIMFGNADFGPGAEYNYAMYIGAALMLGWTVLLLWGFRKPLERKGLVLITACPVVIGMILANIYAVTEGIVQLGNMLPTFIIQSILLVLFIFSYVYSFKKAPQT
jgi:hypothetical protein